MKINMAGAAGWRFFAVAANEVDKFGARLAADFPRQTEIVRYIGGVFPPATADGTL